MSRKRPSLLRNGPAASSLAGVPADGQLLELFVHRDGEAAEWAFAVLVRRHGLMVLRVCAGVLDDPRDRQNAFEATFLVLACRAQAIGGSEPLGAWLFGVARRVAGQRRAELACGAAETAPRSVEGWDKLHREIERLPARLRAPVVLCELEGLAVPEAAARLQWPAGKVERRLARARARLARRGVAVPVAAGSGSPPLPLPASLADSALAIVRGTTAIASSVAVASSDAVASLAHPVLHSLSLDRLRATACVMVAGVSVLLGAGFGAHRFLADADLPATVGRPPAPSPVPGKVEAAGRSESSDQRVTRPGPAEAPFADEAQPTLWEMGSSTE